MVEASYDIMLVYNSEAKDIEVTGETECPVCEEPVFPDLTEEVMDAALDYGIEAPFDCPDCDTALVFIIEPTATGEVGLGISVVRDPR
ncbi:hypothetical protein [Saliphagus infecundisoli]|uniref:DPH-type MB domain-containing protein n=1 Tax=Saliphagus infecundisoli TaxID=1849069 RepID=A0ABD5QI45_9EURY|nr:hypothetical protein [Saliphagus infecundisoli]